MLDNTMRQRHAMEQFKKVGGRIVLEVSDAGRSASVIKKNISPCLISKRVLETRMV